MDSDSEDDQNIVTTETPPQKGCPTGKNDSAKRYRRTSREISEDKIRVAQIRVDALREMEEKRLANKKTRSRPSRPRQIKQIMSWKKASYPAELQKR